MTADTTGRTGRRHTWRRRLTLGLAALATPAIVGLALSVDPGSAQAETSGAPGVDVPAPTHPEATGTSFRQIFDGPLDERDWFIADFVYKSDAQRTGWERDHVTFENGEMRLKLTPTPKQGQPNTGAEVSRKGRFHYGRYEVVMRAAPGSGTVSSMFTHTGAYFGDPHDEVDIEFLGKDLRSVHPNYFTDGKSASIEPVKLPYDASEVFQLYAFEWDADEIRWYVGDELVSVATQADHPIPTTPGRLMVNLWTGSPAQYDWHGRPDFGPEAVSAYKCLSFRLPGDTETPQCSDWFESDLPPVTR